MQSVYKIHNNSAKSGVSSRLQYLMQKGGTKVALGPVLSLDHVCLGRRAKLLDIKGSPGGGHLDLV